MEVSLYDSDRILNGPHMGPIEMPSLEAVDIVEAKIDGKVLKHTVSSYKRTSSITTASGISKITQDYLASARLPKTKKYTSNV